MQTAHLNQDFKTCLSTLMEHGLVAFPRGQETREVLNYNITLVDPRERVITFKDRNTNTQYLVGELLWYLKGSNNPEGILPYSKFWNNIRNTVERPGYPVGEVNSNYGNRLFGYSEVPAFNGLNQWNETVELLKRDRDTRQAIINIHVPTDRHESNKDVACTLSLQFFIRENKLHLIVNMRSNDIILGFTNDVFQFTMLQEIMLIQLKKYTEGFEDLELGYYYHNAGSMHIYERHFEMANKIIGTENAYDLSMIEMDDFNVIIASALFQLEMGYQNSSDKENFKFDAFPEWEHLTPYWKNVMNAFFLKDEDAMHEIFGQSHD